VALVERRNGVVAYDVRSIGIVIESEVESIIVNPLVLVGVLQPELEEEGAVFLGYLRFC
jgi:hypothetical protein